MSPALLKKRATYADLIALPENVTGQIIDGDLYTMPRPAPRHVAAEGALQVLLGGPLQFGSGGGPGGWWILPEPEVHLGPHVVVPDLAGWRKSRLPQVPTQGQFTLSPDWVCENLSHPLRPSITSRSAGFTRNRACLTSLAILARPAIARVPYLTQF